MFVVVGGVSGDVEEAGGGRDFGLVRDELLAEFGEFAEGVEFGLEGAEVFEELLGCAAVALAELEEAEVGGEEVGDKGSRIGDRGSGLRWWGLGGGWRIWLGGEVMGEGVEEE